ncbi:1,4-Dihydroxy-2-naphthoyl-CoA synthase [Dethiosulfatibacter aminovorans DSM 17477]|uniref:1,4-Dihydroxy-2-naphthoyl-CoA synthase n=1 Tax=Dethiosulfatibacter aminovorans DSM 17477 TaxID=1121476 RepID=A0A1M6EP44_9FIRM|nr:enoyl-CoA hydratase-related protein [Dethiosulfatibacter aminovorans]SHI87030.1 1,4-Dihydroxy-2-naphthoyl-CoA synthase [Dethiosulfatibacter aminovorans DSM 17477]
MNGKKTMKDGNNYCLEYSTFECEKQGAILTVKLTNPEKLNALTAVFLKEFSDMVDFIALDDEILVVTITGQGKVFIAGADVELMSTMNPKEAALYAYNTTEMYRKMENVDKIFIASINGYTFGGGLVVACICDLRVASTKATFGYPEVGLGIFPGGCGTVKLSRLIGIGKAKELSYTGRRISAEEAYRIGLLNVITEPENLKEETDKLAQEIVKNSKSAVRLVKEAYNYGADLPEDVAVNQEKNLFAMCFATEDQKEGMRAFLEKRPPNFK